MTNILFISSCYSTVPPMDFVLKFNNAILLTFNVYINVLISLLYPIIFSLYIIDTEMPIYFNRVSINSIYPCST